MNRSLRAKVRRRARGRCEYCRIPIRLTTLRGEVDHIIAEQHGGVTILSNLALACSHCNSHKGPNIASIDPQTATLVPLFNPRADRWERHFKWSGPVLVGLTPTGRASIRTLFINDPLEIMARSALMEEDVF